MTSVATASGLLPDTGSADLFVISGKVRILGISGVIEVQADDPYSMIIKVAGTTVANPNVGGQPAGRVIESGGTQAGAGALFGACFVPGDGVITIESSDGPGAGAASWTVLYEALEPDAGISEA